MKLAVITDAHGNYHGLEAVLNDIEKEKPDCVISAGDMLHPLPASLKTGDRFKREKIPMILGNNEELVIGADSDVGAFWNVFNGVIDSVGVYDRARRVD